MSTNRYLARELLAQHTRQKKQKKLEQRRLLLEQKAKQKKQDQRLLFFGFGLFSLPLFLFPAYPKNQWQYDLYRYITEEMFIIVGTKGPLPFFTILSSIYTTLVMMVFCCYLFFLLIKKFRINKEFQEFVYSKFFQAEFESSKRYPWLEKPLIKKIIVSGMFLLCLLMGVLHFIFDEISFKTGSRRGALIEFSYNYKIGVIFWEFIFSIFTIFPFFYFGLFTIYLFNYFFRGLGTGKIIIPLKTIRKRKRRGKRKN
ncbi:hypothetical protein [Acinetobacter sp. NIPH 2699]|uniref:hypothetical protein n=1 Tax=Acinetobacter sp. NIPH 2699 TaxID=2923433 RepID=UPI001F4A7470|nr:hypothetical protein [Acinetobacter sp. NIPH 2699]MCH7337193.1 hypothetical protein [Acinetobacter sp. NIPH 2699]